MLFTTIETIASITFFASAITGMVFFDIIVRLERDHFNSSWLSDGSPKPFFMFPGDPSFSQSFLRTKIMFSWLFSNPHWASNDKKARTLLISYRSVSLLNLIAWLVLVIEMIKRFNA